MINPASEEYLGQDLEIELIRTLAPHLRERFFVDVGAEKGRFARAMFACGMRGALFEPLPRHRETLTELALQHDSQVYPYAIDEENGRRELFIACDADGNELNYFHSLQKVTGAAQFRHGGSVWVDCRCLESLVSEGALPEAVGILKTDTEGHDIHVLRGLGPMRPELVVCEYFTDGLYPGWEDARPEIAIALLRSKGYKRYLATKRVGEYEYCAASPMGFLPKQWGNLFFLDDELFAAAEGAIAALLATVEARFIGAVQAMAADRVAKESLIQDLVNR